MAANRTFNFMGQAYGSTPVTVQAVIRGSTVFDGTVPTVDSALPTIPPDPTTQVVLFQIADNADLNTDFAGNVSMQVTVTGGNGCIFGVIDSNYYLGNVGNIANPNPGNYGTPGNFTQCFGGNPTNSEGTPDVRSSVTIDGTTQVPPTPPSTGVYNWIIPNGLTLAYNFNVGIGMVGTATGNTANYTGAYTPVPNFPTFTP